jgi:hypothetical protein
MFERAAIVELTQLADVFAPPCTLGPYMLTGVLASSSSALLYTATRGTFDDGEGVLKLTTSHHAARLRAELDVLMRCADAGVEGVIRPVLRELEWLAVPELADAHVAVMALPFFSGGDLHAVRRTRGTSQEVAREVALRLAATLRHLLELEEPLVHGALGPRSVLLPSPGAELSQLTLIDFGAAHNLRDVPSEEMRKLCATDVAGYGTIMLELTQDSRGKLTEFASACASARYPSMADRRLWRDLQHATLAGARRALRWPW